jgi:hypothetical protein
LTPGAVIAIEEIGPNLTHRVEAVPRNEAAMDEFGPAGTLLFEQSEGGRRALESFQRALETGEQVTISEGVALRFDRLPPLMKPHVSGAPMQDLEITIGPNQSGPPSPWPARIVASSDAGVGEIEIDLEPVQPPPPWHGALQGSRGGLTATLLFRRTPKPGVTFNFNFSYDSALPVADQLAATTTLAALHGRGTLAIHARDLSRPEPLNFDFERNELPPFFSVLNHLLGDLRLIEEWTETTLKLPPEISREEMVAVAELGYIIRNGKSRMTFDQITLELDDEKYEPFKAGVPGPLRMGMPLAANLFGREIALGHLVGELSPNDVKVARVTPVENADPAAWSVRLEPATDEGRNPIFRLQPEPPEQSAVAPSGESM